jgi:pyridoxal phosphate enzyme (YggS family)
MEKELSSRLEQVRARIASAASRSGRRAEDITVVAVTKVFPASVIRDAYALGLRDFGENYLQEFEGKYQEVKDLSEAHFHLIGHLQSNKAKRAAELFRTIQTVDTEKLARRLDAVNKPLDVMLEVKLSSEEAKSGADPSELSALIAAVKSCPNLSLRGLMTMPPWSDDPEISRPYFRRLRELAAEHGLAQLSMGMSHDLEAAIEEGATHVRVGTALFGRRK